MAADAEPDEHAEPGGHVPMVSAAEAERIRRWHQAGYARRSHTTQTFDYLGISLVVPPEVQPITGMSHLLGQAVLAEVRDGDRVLDMGTGSGVNAILAATASTRVLAVDNNPVAVQCARRNAARNGVTGQITVRHSDVFGNVDGAFDLIIFDPPFRWFTPRDLRESASTDPGYRAMTTFFRDARRHLTPHGRMLIFFGTSGDLAYLRHLAGREGFTTRIVAHQDLVKDGWRVDYYTFRITP